MGAVSIKMMFWSFQGPILHSPEYYSPQQTYKLTNLLIQKLKKGYDKKIIEDEDDKSNHKAQTCFNTFAMNLDKIRKSSTKEKANLKRRERKHLLTNYFQLWYDCSIWGSRIESVLFSSFSKTSVIVLAKQVLVKPSFFWCLGADPDFEVFFIWPRRSIRMSCFFTECFPVFFWRISTLKLVFTVSAFVLYLLCFCF